MSSLSSYLKVWERICSNFLLGIGIIALLLIGSSESLSTTAILIGGTIAVIMFFGGLYWHDTIPKKRHRRAVSQQNPVSLTGTG